MIACFFLAIEMALQFGVDVLFTKQIDQPLGGCLRVPGVFSVAGIEHARDWTIKTAGQTDEALRVCGKLIGSNTVLGCFGVFRHTQFHQGDETTEVLVTSAVTHQHGNRADSVALWQANSFFSADVRLEITLFCGEMQTRRALNALAIQEST